MKGMIWAGLDIGGANIKLASSEGDVRQVPYPLWKNPAGLARRLADVLQAGRPYAGVAAAMTGELADCFASREQGVVAIARSAEAATRGGLLRWFGLDGNWASTEELLKEPAKYAASNWLALGTLIARQQLNDSLLVVDIGTTTTDVIPVREGRVLSVSRTDTQRLTSGELVYCGVERTPLCALVSSLPYRGHLLPVAGEWFATTLDVFTTLGHLPESMVSQHTADGRAATRAACQRRLARMVLAIGAGEFDEEDARRIAAAVKEAIVARIARAVRCVADRYAMPVSQTRFTGRGQFLGPDVLAALGEAQPVAKVGDCLLNGAGNCAPAFALAMLAAQDLGSGK